MRRFFKGLVGVVLGGSFGEETVINVLAGGEDQRRAKWKDRRKIALSRA
ncbi:hypothetical protein KJ693_06110 [bacterium]|nr:hypothetical protein [bacterium]MBU1614874.1 hypothetical protein [bacterium]